jgi:putative resolvase
VNARRSIAGRWTVAEAETNRLLGVKKQQQGETRRVILYARVSSHEQKDHLKSQIERLQKYASDKGYEVIKTHEEIASGLNENRRKLTSAYEMLKRGDADMILVEFKDRLSRFGFNYLRDLAESYGGDVEIVNGDVKKDAMQEVVEDMISVVTIFSAKLYGLRSQKFRKVTGAVKGAVHS